MARAGASAQEVPTFTLTGKVVDRASNTPVVAAVIKVPELERFVFTDGDGEFRFADFPQGTWEVIVEQFGYHTMDDSVTVSEGNGLFIRLNPDPIELDELRVRTRSERLLTRRRQRIPYRVVTIRTEAFANAINTDPTAIFRRAANMAFVGCPGVVGEWIAQGCIARKGGSPPFACTLTRDGCTGECRTCDPWTTSPSIPWSGFPARRCCGSIRNGSSTGSTTPGLHWSPWFGEGWGRGPLRPPRPPERQPPAQPP